MKELMDANPAPSSDYDRLIGLFYDPAAD
jgi:hypothetical protein